MQEKDIRTFTNMDISVLNKFGAATIKHEQISCNQAPAQYLPDGTGVVRNDNGDIIFAHYASGAKVIRFAEYVLCTNEAGDHWFGGKQSRWFKLD